TGPANSDELTTPIRTRPIIATAAIAIVRRSAARKSSRPAVPAVGRELLIGGSPPAPDQFISGRGGSLRWALAFSTSCWYLSSTFIVDRAVASSTVSSPSASSVRAQSRVSEIDGAFLS